MIRIFPRKNGWGTAGTFCPIVSPPYNSSMGAVRSAGPDSGPHMNMGSIRPSKSATLRWGAFLVAGLYIAGTGPSAIALQPGGVEGICIPVQSPLSSQSVEWIRQQLNDARKSSVRPPAKIVFDFNPDDKDAHSPSFAASYELAKLISTINDVPTIAFVHGKVTGHLVFPVLMCQDVVLSRSASIGEVTEPGQTLDVDHADLYSKLIEPRRRSHMAAIRKMFDVNIELLRGKDKTGGVILVEASKKAKAEADGIVFADPRPIPFAPRGKLGLYSAQQAEDLGISRTRAENLVEVAEVFGINPKGLRPLTTSDRPPLGFKYTLRGEIDYGKKESLLRSLRDVVRQKGTIVFLQLECGGGDLNAARDLAAELQNLQQPGEDTLRIVAFVPDNAPDTATVIALGCSDIVMSRRKDARAGADISPEATIGDFEAYLGRGKEQGDTRELIATSLTKLAEEQHYSTVLVRGMVDPTIGIVWVRKANDASIRRVMTMEEFEGDKANWVQDKVIKPKGTLLKLTATEAEQLGIARFVVDGRDVGEVAVKYGLEPTKLREATPGSLDQFAAFLRIPAVTVLLVLIGFTGLILELKVPGATVPGIVAALSFILLFWAHTQFSGQVAVLAGSIFVLGLVLILLEVFVVPGFGAPGVLGILFMLSGLALATMDSIPTTASGWGTFGIRSSQFLFSMIGSVGLAFLIARFLPNIPYANRMMLMPPADKTDPITELKETVAGAAQAMELIGAVGTAVTVLRPAGNVRFGDQFVDVVADGGYIPAGARVKVVLVEGNRIVVKEV
jgi:membrane-bound serine protease (ClpP class)